MIVLPVRIEARNGEVTGPDSEKKRMTGNRYNNYVEDVQEEKVPLPVSREPGRVPSQVPSADLAQGLYKHPDKFITFKRAA